MKGVGEKIKLFGRNKKGQKIIIDSYGYNPSFYVLDTCVVPFHEKIEKKERGFKSYSGEGVIKITTKNSNDVPSVRKMFQEKECFEEDVLYFNRWAIDVGIKNLPINIANQTKHIFANL